jgi:hypothetical protein
MPERFLWLDISEEAEADSGARLLAGEYIADCLREGRSVLLHSSHGRHRVRWAYVAYRLVSGARLSAALKQAAERPWLAPYHTDRKAWELLEVRLARRTDLRAQAGPDGRQA